MQDRSSNAVYALVAAMAAVVVLSVTWAPHLSTSGDNVEYIKLAQDLPSFESTKYPPVYPILLALVGAQSLTAMKMVAGVCYVGLAALVGGWLGLVPAALVLSIPTLIVMSSQVMADVPLALCVTAALLLYLSWDKPPRRAWLAALGLLILAAWIKTAAAMILLGVVLAHVRWRDWRTVCEAATAFAVAVVPWVLWTHLQGGNTYLGQIFLAHPYYPEMGLIPPLGLAVRAWSNLVFYISRSPELAVLALLGALSDSEVRRAGFVLLPYVALILIWPWQAERFLLPVLPILCAFLGRVLVVRAQHAWSSWKPFYGPEAQASAWLRAAHFAPLLIPALILLIGRTALTAGNVPDRLPIEWERYRDVALWARDNLPEDAVIATRKSGWFGLHANRRCERFVFAEPDSLWADLEAKGATHVVVDRLGYAATERHLVPALQAHADRLKVVARSEAPETILLALTLEESHAEADTTSLQ